MDNSEQSLADEIAAGREGYSADMAKAMGWMETRSPRKGEPSFWVRTPDGKYSPECPDYENNPRHAFDECVRMGWDCNTHINVETEKASARIYAGEAFDNYALLANADRDDLDITRAINEALCRAVGV